MTERNQHDATLARWRSRECALEGGLPSEVIRRLDGLRRQHAADAEATETTSTRLDQRTAERVARYARLGASIRTDRHVPAARDVPDTSARSPGMVRQPDRTAPRRTAPAHSRTL